MPKSLVKQGEEVVVSPDAVSDEQRAQQEANFYVALMEWLDHEGIPHAYIGPTDDDDSEGAGVRMLGTTNLAKVEVWAVEVTDLGFKKLDVPVQRVSSIGSAQSAHVDVSMISLADRVFFALCRFYEEKGLYLGEATVRIGWGCTVASGQQTFVVSEPIGPDDLIVLRGSKRLGTNELLTLF